VRRTEGERSWSLVEASARKQILGTRTDSVCACDELLAWHTLGKRDLFALKLATHAGRISALIAQPLVAVGGGH
jgi:hypothetical protein